MISNAETFFTSLLRLHVHQGVPNLNQIHMEVSWQWSFKLKVAIIFNSTKQQKVFGGD